MNHKTTESSKCESRVLALDCARIIAVMAVIMIHITMNFYFFEPHTSSFKLGNILDSLSRFAVPLFVMVSGALMLDEKKEIPIKKLFLKYILNIVILFVAWSFIYTAFELSKALSDGQKLTFAKIVSQLVFGEFHMWYLVMIVGLYLTIPVLKLFVKKENSDKIAYAIGISLLFIFLSSVMVSLSEVSYVFGWMSRQFARFEYCFIGVYPTYFLTGWYVFHVGIKHKKCVYLSAVISLLMIILMVQYTNNFDDIYSNGNMLIYLYSLGVFLFINELCINKTSNKRMANISNLTFGVYIVHVLVLYGVNLLFDNSQITLLSVSVKFVLTTVISFVLTYLISKIPGLRRLVRF